MKKVLLLSVLCALFSGCTDTYLASLDALGKSGKIICYSGGIPFYSGESTGKISTVSHSDGWEFKDSKTGIFVRVSGDCLIKN
jgi:hypothetical protein